ncbi:hypothetical protein ACQ4N7_06570 [Nodosilinea sp. AN01ver1]|uniref:hypothetical protein n=1 Tax=Nodosilinea sp. AN01ver1 TaxID=3423362 RepID=UPI003D31F419
MSAEKEDPCLNAKLPWAVKLPSPFKPEGVKNPATVASKLPDGLRVRLKVSRVNPIPSASPLSQVIEPPLSDHEEAVVLSKAKSPMEKVLKREPKGELLRIVAVPPGVPNAELLSIKSSVAMLPTPTLDSLAELPKLRFAPAIVAACTGASRTTTAEKAAAALRPRPKAFKLIICIYLVCMNGY